jgi:hypothetical protein
MMSGFTVTGTVIQFNVVASSPSIKGVAGGGGDCWYEARWRTHLCIAHAVGKAMSVVNFQTLNSSATRLCHAAWWPLASCGSPPVYGVGGGGLDAWDPMQAYMC